ncbi:MAG: hypothetical protein OXI50_10410, partial [Gammaproteobacteria bacterium]|nr:hypothetical protein [Gammaproteobacteria bacterium]
MADTPGDLRLAFSDQAIAALKSALDGYPEPVSGVRLKIIGRSGRGFDHVITIVERGAEPDDPAVDLDGLHVYVEREHADKLNGVAVHYDYKGPNESGLEFDNPNPVWDNPLEERVQI